MVGDAALSVIERIQRVVTEMPGATAVVDDSFDAPWTYGELDEITERLASYIAHRVAPETVVACVTDANRWRIACMLAVWKANAIYLPVDPQNPVLRVSAIFNAAKPALILTDGSREARSCLPEETDPIDVRNASMQPGRTPLRSACDSAFLIFTSGSTGTPKGVLQTHQCVDNLISWQIAATNPPHKPRAWQYFNAGFDACLHESLFVLSLGGELHIVPENIRHEPKELAQFIKERRLELIWMPAPIVPLLIHALAGDCGSSLCYAVSTGDRLVLDRPIRRALCSMQLVLYNFYGPTESHVAMAHKVEARDLDTVSLEAYEVPIGKAIAGADILVVDDNGLPVALDVEGELMIGGAPLALGYFGDPAQTAARFVIAGEPPRRMYATGDIVSESVDGTFRFLGRRSEGFVKLRGFRVELREVELALLAHPAVSEAVVRHLREGPLADRLVAFVAGYADLSVHLLRKWLLERLPEYMIPAYFDIRDRLPRNASGKIDGASLRVVLDSLTVPVASPDETILAGLWAAVIGVPLQSVDDSFFEAGGDSLRAIAFCSGVEAELQVPFEFSDLITHHRFAELAELVACRRHLK